MSKTKHIAHIYQVINARTCTYVRDADLDQCNVMIITNYDTPKTDSALHFQ